MHGVSWSRVSEAFTRQTSEHYPPERDSVRDHKIVEGSGFALCFVVGDGTKAC